MLPLVTRGDRDVKTVIHWLTMPVKKQVGRNALPALKYDVPDAVIVRHSDTAYVGIADGEVAERLLANPDVEILKQEEKDLVELVPGMPVAWESLERQIPSRHADHRRKSAVGLGDVISVLTRRAHIPECGSCVRRRKGLNRITVWGWWRNRKLLLQPEG